MSEFFTPQIVLLDALYSQLIWIFDMFICCYNWLPEFGEISLHVIKIILLKINSIDFMMRYKNVQYWILWYSICSWTDYLSQDRTHINLIRCAKIQESEYNHVSGSVVEHFSIMLTKSACILKYGLVNFDIWKMLNTFSFGYLLIQKSPTAEIIGIYSIGTIVSI